MAMAPSAVAGRVGVGEHLAEAVGRRKRVGVVADGDHHGPADLEDPAPEVGELVGGERLDDGALTGDPALGPVGRTVGEEVVAEFAGVLPVLGRGQRLELVVERGEQQLLDPADVVVGEPVERRQQQVAHEFVERRVELRSADVGAVVPQAAVEGERSEGRSARRGRGRRVGRPRRGGSRA